MTRALRPLRPSAPPIDFRAASFEYLRLVARRRDLMAFLGSCVAGLSILFTTAASDGLPTPLHFLRPHLLNLALAALALLSVVICARELRLRVAMRVHIRLVDECCRASRRAPVRVHYAEFLPGAGQSDVVDELISPSGVLIAGAGLTGVGSLALVMARWGGHPSFSVLGVLLFGAFFVRMYSIHRAWANQRYDELRDDLAAQVSADQYNEYLHTALAEVHHDLAGLLLLNGGFAFSIMQVIVGISTDAARTLTGSESQLLAVRALLLGTGLAVSATAFAAQCRLRFTLGKYSIMRYRKDRAFEWTRITDSAYVMGLNLLIGSATLALAVLILGGRALAPWATWAAGAYLVAGVACDRALLIAGARWHLRYLRGH